MRSKNNLKQIALALSNYHDAMGRYPNDTVDKDGKPLLSWRVQLLPYLEQDNLYKQFDFSQAWDSKANKPLLKQIVPTFSNDLKSKQPELTYIKRFYCEGTVLQGSKRFTEEDVKDERKHTLAVIEAGPPVEWSKPDDLPFDPKKPIPKLAGPFGN